MTDKEQRKLKRISLYLTYARRRDELGLTDYAVAKSTGLSRSVFTDWKNGKSMPKLDKLTKISKVLKISVNKLLK